jgi:16S rRNA (cytidine1402-2'-O)-methyltransferase
MGTLFIIATPIGNLADITIRALKTLFAVDVLACEDTRRTGLLLEKLLQEFSFEEKPKPKFLSYYDQNELQRIPEIIELLQAGKNIGLVSDAGTPLISDPGFKLVRECLAKGIKVESLPGASSVLSALTSSGLPTDKFFFVGYPPHKSGHRLKFFEQMKEATKIVPATVIFFEAPHKLITTLTNMREVFGDSEVVLCRELTKMHEEIIKKPISQLLAQYKKTKPRGEYTILLHR